MFQGEDFRFENDVGFGDVKFTVFGASRGHGHAAVALGKIVIPKPSSSSATEEQWYMLMDPTADAKINGSVEIKIKHFPPKEPRKVHGFSVNVVRAKNITEDQGFSPHSYFRYPKLFCCFTFITRSRSCHFSTNPYPDEDKRTHVFRNILFVIF